MYVIRASYVQDGQTLDCSQAEVLGGAFQAEYATEQEAADVAAELQESVADVGLDPTTKYVVEKW
jgi:hypothetical protein